MLALLYLPHLLALHSVTVSPSCQAAGTEINLPSSLSALGIKGGASPPWPLWLVNAWVLLPGSLKSSSLGRESWVCLNQVIYPDGLSVVTAAQVLRKYDINTSQELRTKRSAAFEAPSWRRGPEWMRVVELQSETESFSEITSLPTRLWFCTGTTRRHVLQNIPSLERG